MATNDGAMVASNIPRRNRQIIRPVKLVAAADTVVTVLPDQQRETQPLVGWFAVRSSVPKTYSPAG